MLRLVLKIDNGGVKAIGSFFFGSNKFQSEDTGAESTIYSLFFKAICTCSAFKTEYKFLV